MCMIAYRPVRAGKRGSNIPTQVIDTALNRHPDGFGVAWREGGELHVRKFAPQGKKAFRKLLKRLDQNATLEYVAHFRYATHGPEDEAHAHPFEYTDPIEGRVLVFHNGVIDIPTTPTESDTEVFVRDILPNLPAQWWDVAPMVWMVREAIGWSKLTLMTPKRTIIIGEKSGEWDTGLWYSSNHRSYTTYTYKGGTAYGANTVQTSAVVPYGGVGTPAKEAAKVLGLDVEAEDADIIIPDVQRPYQWRHGGHTLTALAEIDRGADSGDYPNGIMCDMCMTTGDVYVIDGTTFVDIKHILPADIMDMTEREIEAF